MDAEEPDTFVPPLPSDEFIPPLPQEPISASLPPLPPAVNQDAASLALPNEPSSSLSPPTAQSPNVNKVSLGHTGAGGVQTNTHRANDWLPVNFDNLPIAKRTKLSRYGSEMAVSCGGVGAR